MVGGIIGGYIPNEIKHNGYRLMARRDPVGIRLLTRNGNDWSSRFPLVVEAVNHLKVRSDDRPALAGPAFKVPTAIDTWWRA